MNEAQAQVLDHDRLNTLRDLGQPEGDAFIVELIEVFLEDVDGRMESVRAAVGRGDASALADAAHTLKGCCNNIGARAMADAARVIEMAAREGRVDPCSELVDHLEERFRLTRPALCREMEESRDRSSS